MGSNASLLSILKLNKRFGTHRALHAIDFQVSHGEIVLLLGSNGSGKSTLLKLCAGLLRPSAGRIDVRDTSIGYAGHEAMLYGELTVEENLEFFGALTNHSQNIAPALRTWNLEVHRKKRISELSQGLRHRASLARMMLSQPKTLLLDEPTNALDAEAVDTLSALVHGASKSGAAVIATHDIEQLRPIATRAVLLADGAIASDSASSENSENIDSVISLYRRRNR